MYIYIYICMYIYMFFFGFFSPVGYYKILQNIEYSSLWYTAIQYKRDFNTKEGQIPSFIIGLFLQ